MGCVTMTERFWTGIGSRRTPKSLAPKFKRLAESLTALGFTLRSGGCLNSPDVWFEAGSDPARSEIYLPWRGAFGHASQLCEVSDDAIRTASKHHPNWQACSSAARKLHGRNCYQVLGSTLDAPSEFVVCWTPGGAAIGGTGLAIRLAREHAIPIFNLYFKSDEQALLELIERETQCDAVASKN